MAMKTRAVCLLDKTIRRIAALCEISSLAILYEARRNAYRVELPSIEEVSSRILGIQIIIIPGDCGLTECSM